MKTPPRFALAVLGRLVPDSGSLAGDLVEEYDRGRSRAWVWWQVLSAGAIAAFTRRDEIRPLHLVELQPVDAVERSRRLGLRFGNVNLTASPVQGIGGLGLLVLAALLTVVMPGAWYLLLAAALAGTLLGLGLILRHRSHPRPSAR